MSLLKKKEKGIHSFLLHKVEAGHGDLLTFWYLFQKKEKKIKLSRSQSAEVFFSGGGQVKVAADWFISIVHYC